MFVGQCVLWPSLLTQGMQCAVCLEQQSSVSQSDWARANPCGHRFHTACVAGWLVDKGTCPQCRVAVTHASTTAQWPPTFTAPTALSSLRKLVEDNASMKVVVFGMAGVEDGTEYGPFRSAMSTSNVGSLDLSVALYEKTIFSGIVVYVKEDGTGFVEKMTHTPGDPPLMVTPVGLGGFTSCVVRVAGRPDQTIWDTARWGE